MSGLYETPLKLAHLAEKARMVPFAGWEMPVQYTGVKEEHLAVRQRAGLFDLSHMAEIEISGLGATDLLQRLTTNDVSQCAEWQAQYTMMCNEQGGILDDMLVYRFPDKWWVVANASNYEKILGWIQSQATPEVEVIDRSLSTALIAIQGPASEMLLQELTEQNLGGLGYYRFFEGSVAGVSAVISRTGYTGEDGFELYLPWEKAQTVWEACSRLDSGVPPIGLGARDTLRLEAGYPLYGHELSEDWTPYDASAGWAVKLDQGEFLGSQALAAYKESGEGTRIIRLIMEGKAIPRQGYDVLADGVVIGQVTSGTFSPSLEVGIALARVEKAPVKTAQQYEIQVRARRQSASMTKKPFIEGSIKR